MKKLILATTLSIILSSASQYAFAAHSKNKDIEERQKEQKVELIGLSSGAVTGALIGGPVGAVVGGLFGVFIADDMNGDKQYERVQTELVQANSKIEAQHSQLLAFERNLEELERQQLIQLASLEDEENTAIELLNGFEANIQFKTSSSDIASLYHIQLSKLAKLMKENPEISAKVIGYADQRGDSQYNQNLSLQRAESVQHFLIEAGAKKDQIVAKGAGEVTGDLAGADSQNANQKPINAWATKPTPTPTPTPTPKNSTVISKANTLNTTHVSHEDLFFARNVNIQILPRKQQLTASN